MADSQQTDTAVEDPSAEYEKKNARLKALATRIHEIIAAAETAEDPGIEQLQTEKADIESEIADLLSQPCAAYRPTPNGGHVTCSRTTGHPDDHFDELAGIGWPNENESPATTRRDPVFADLLICITNAIAVDKYPGEANHILALGAYVDRQREQLERTHAILDRVGVPRDRMENVLELHHRANLFIDRLSKRLHGQVENNMALYHAIRDALTSLVGSPNAGSLRVRSAIERLRGVMPTKKSPGGIHLQ